MPADLVTRLLLKNDQFDKSLKESQKQIKTFNKMTDEVSKSVTASFTSMAKGALALTGVTVALGDVIKKSIEFEKSLSVLQSITGVSTQELDFFKQEAIRLGSTTTQTAQQVVEAFTSIGAAVPELLKNKAALTDFTEQAIILAEAAQTTVPEAAKALTGAINQMGASTNKASEYINILAAASQQGAAEIPYLNEVIEKAGGTASAMKVKFNELVAATEAIAPRFTQAAEAGTSLRNIFLLLEKQVDKNMKPSVVGFTQALNNLADKQYNTTKLLELFGRANVTAALALIDARDAYNELTTSITGTNAALEQQAINNNNVAGSINSVKSAWEGFILTVYKGNGVMKDALDFLAGGLLELTKRFQTEEQKFNQMVNNNTKAVTREVDTQIEKYKELGIVGEEANAKIAESLEKELLSKQQSYTQGLTRLANLQSELKRFEPTNIVEKYLNEGGKGGHLSAADRSKRKALNEEIELQQQINNEYASYIKAIQTGLEYSTEQLTVTKKIRDVGAAMNDDGPARGSLAYIDKQIKEYQDKMSKATTDAARQGFQHAIDVLNREKKEIQFRISWENLKALKAPTIPVLETETEKKVNQRVKKDIDSGKIKVEPVEILKKDTSTLDYLQTIGSLMNNISGATENATAAWLNYSAGILSNITAMLPQVLALANANATLGVTEQAKMPFPLNAIAMAATVAALTASIANIPKFAGGGIVGGSSFAGDRIPAMVNSGEMILNDKQQRNLFNLLNGGGDMYEKSDPVVRIKGEDLYIALKNYNRRRDKIR